MRSPRVRDTLRGLAALGLASPLILPAPSVTVVNENDFVLVVRWRDGTDGDLSRPVTAPTGSTTFKVRLLITRYRFEARDLDGLLVFRADMTREQLERNGWTLRVPRYAGQAPR